LDNPTEFFTAQSLNNRAGDIANLLDGIGNGVQILQAANTGLTSLSSLVSNAQSIANQVLQSPTGYSTKSTVTSNQLTGATASDLLGVAGAATTGTALQNNAATPAPISATTALSGGTTTNDLATGFTTTDTLVVNGTTFSFIAGTSSSGTTIGIGDNIGDLLSAIDKVSGGTSSISSSGQVTINAGASGLTLTGNALTKLGLSSIVGDGLAGETLSIAATGGGTATAITFGLAQGQI